MTDMQAPGCQSGTYDILLAADFTRHGDHAFRLAQEIRAYAGSHATIGLIQTRPQASTQELDPEIATCVRRGLAQVVSAAQRVTAGSLVFHGPGSADPSCWPVLSNSLREVVCVAHAPEDLAGPVGHPFAPAARTHIHAINPALRALASTQVSPHDWLPPVPGHANPVPSVPGRMPAVGWIATAGLDSRELTVCSRREAEHYGWGDAEGWMKPLPAVSLDRLIAGLEVLVVAPAEGEHDLPDTLIASALLAGRSVLMPRRLSVTYGRGPTYFKANELDLSLARALAKTASGKSGHQTADAHFVARCRKGPAAQHASRARPISFRSPRAGTPPDRPLLCLAANGVGVGHLTRLLAIARRVRGQVVFATHAPAVGVVQDFGYPVEYIPSSAAIGGDPDRWDGWFKPHLEHLLDAWDPAVVAYDGNHPTPGLIEAVGARRDCRLAWVRRGMWANTTSPHMPNARWCDLVIEPGELAAARDESITARRRGEARQVDPILLLDREDLPDRARAAAALGLNPARPAVLVQLGSGHNRDLLSLLDQIIPVLAAVPGLQIAVAEWLNGSVPLTLWPQVTVLRGFPINQYARAFDFCISAAGYNAFHEAVSFGVPTIFVANRHPTMDDQYGRARYAQDMAAAFEISEGDLGDLPDLVRLLMQDAARGFLVANCARIARPNGATDAASALAGLAARSMKAMP